MNLNYTFEPDSNPDQAGDYTLIISDVNNPEFSDIIFFNIFKEVGIPEIYDWGSMELSVSNEYREEFNKSIKPEQELAFMIELFSEEMRS